MAKPTLTAEERDAVVDAVIEEARSHVAALRRITAGLVKSTATDDDTDDDEGAPA